VTAVLVKEQHVYYQGIPGLVTQTGRGFAIIELDDGRVVIASEEEVIPAESPKSAQDRQTPG